MLTPAIASKADQNKDGGRALDGLTLTVREVESAEEIWVELRFDHSPSPEFERIAREILERISGGRYPAETRAILTDALANASERERATLQPANERRGERQQKHHA